MNAAATRSENARLTAAIAELEAMILSRYPTATFVVSHGDDPEGIYLIATVDVDDPDDVTDLVIDRTLTMQIEEQLPVYVVPVRTATRRAALAHPARPAAIPHAVVLP